MPPISVVLVFVRAAHLLGVAMPKNLPFDVTSECGNELGFLSLVDSDLGVPLISHSRPATISQEGVGERPARNNRQAVE